METPKAFSVRSGLSGARAAFSFTRSERVAKCPPRSAAAPAEVAAGEGTDEAEFPWLLEDEGSHKLVEGFRL